LGFAHIASSFLLGEDCRRGLDNGVRRGQPKIGYGLGGSVVEEKQLSLKTLTAGFDSGLAQKKASGRDGVSGRG
jgi:hypothetical protein